ncbi:MFS transporter [Deinococcus lacus]|uniref:MFS transporter n=1 Tax=Deinococcus lacus TaxID=392561 RepID=A0ABW1YDA6_9DEIO
MPHSTGALPQASTLWNRNFTLYWLASVQSVFGNSLSTVVTAVLVYGLTGKASSMGVTLALGMLPALLGPFAGVVVDKVPVRSLLIAGDLLRGVLVAALAFMATTGQAELWMLNVVVFMAGLVTAFTAPATQVLLPQLVSEEHLARANGLMTTGNQTAQLLGLFLGAGLVSAFGAGPSLWVDALTFFVMAGLLTLVRLPARVEVPAAESFWTALTAGFRVLREHPGFAMIPVLAFVINVAFAPVEMVLPKHLVTLGLGESLYGVALATVVAGMVAGGLGVTALGQRFKPKLALPLGLMATGAGLMAFGLVKLPAAFFAFAAVIGVGISLTNTSIAYLGQTLIPAEFRGRVFGLINATAQAGMPIALIALGPVADSWGSARLMLLAGLTVIVATAVWWWQDRSSLASDSLSIGSN